jgi:hypothetical protein
MYIVSEHWWPPGKSEQIGKLYLEAMQKFPDDRSIAKPIIQSAVWTTTQGMHSITVSEVKPGKVREAMDIVSNRLLLIAVVEGFQYQINVAYTLVEAMPFVGITSP